MAGSENINVTCYLYVTVQIETNQVKNKYIYINQTSTQLNVDFVGLFEKQNQHLFKNSFSTTTTTNSGTFPFTCPVTALPVSYRRSLTLCTALSTSPPGHPALPVATFIDVVSLLAIELNILILVRRR